MPPKRGSKKTRYVVVRLEQAGLPKPPEPAIKRANAITSKRIGVSDAAQVRTRYKVVEPLEAVVAPLPLCSMCLTVFPHMHCPVSLEGCGRTCNSGCKLWINGQEKF